MKIQTEGDTCMQSDKNVSRKNKVGRYKEISNITGEELIKSGIRILDLLNKEVELRLSKMNDLEVAEITSLIKVSFQSIEIGMKIYAKSIENSKDDDIFLFDDKDNH